LHLGSRLIEPGPHLQDLLSEAGVPELLAMLPSQTAAAPVASPAQIALAAALRRAEELLEGWFREQADHPVPPAVTQEISRAAQQLDDLGEDKAALLLEEARQQLASFSAAAQVSEAQLEPVAEALAGLHQYADSLVAGDALAATRLEALRDRLRVLPETLAAPTSRPAAAVPDLVAHGIDETLFGVFLEEADALLRGIQADARTLAEIRPPQATVDALRAALQTLRGSGLMTGLLPLAQLCGELDHTLAAWTPRGEPGWEAPARLMADAAREMERWLARLASDRGIALPAVTLIDRARALRAQPALSLAPLISLQDIFLEEAGDRVEDLQTALGSEPRRLFRVGDALRAVHTLSGIARTAGHPGMAELAHAMETVIEVLRGGLPDASTHAVHERLHAAAKLLAEMRASLVAGRQLMPADELARVLRRDADLLHEQAMSRDTDGERAPQPVIPDLDDDVVDHPDAELLPVFLEECAELMPQLDAALRAWSEGGGLEQGARALKRGLHTLKGSARISGLLRQGALAHRLEDLVLRWSDHGAVPDAQAFEEIQAGLDGLALGIEHLAHPHASPAPAAEASTPPLPLVEAPALAFEDPLADAIGVTAAPLAEPTSAGSALGELDHVAIGEGVTVPATAVDQGAPGMQSDLPPVSSDQDELPQVLPSAANATGADEVTAAADVQASPDAAAPGLEYSPTDKPAEQSEASVTPLTASPVPELPLPPTALDAPAPTAESVSPVLRIRVEVLDRMANAAGEAGIGRARVETEAAVLKRGLSDLAENIQRLKSQLREIEIHAERALPAMPEGSARHGFDPLEMDRYSRLQELARTLTEGIDDVQTVHHGLRRGIDEVELALRGQGRVIRDLQQDLLRARMVPFASLAERLQRTARQAARESGRELVFQLEGGQHEVDRSILERLAAPLEHILRNAAVHGIEPAEVRRDLGKPTQGQLTIHLAPGEHEVSLRISDDGRGVDLARVRTQAEVQGLLPTGQTASDEELLQLIFRPGFSTARSVTSLAGRGVGLDVVRSEVLSLGGRIHIDTRPGAGTDFTLVIPVTLATVQAVVVRAGDAWFAIPAPLVEQVRPVAREALADLYRERVAVWQGLRYPFTSLTRVLGLGRGEPEPQGAQQLVYLRSADRRCALRVDELAGTQEIVVKTVSPHLARIPGVTGASVLGNGRIVLILNPVPLTVGLDGMIPDALQPAEPAPEAPNVMVVDDSITVRRVTSRLLERAGYQVQLAKDGQDALEQIEQQLPDAVLMDVEMPRMDGFELIARLRANPRTAALPVVVITSRTAERHRNHAESLGVQGYLGKPYREEDLTALLATLLQHACPLPARAAPPDVPPPPPAAASGGPALTLVR
jgi:chemosensory pili system protein ChpA (sensor histidine kinase/response regulator)